MIPEEDLLDELRRLADGSEPPTIGQMNADGKYSHNPYFDRWGNWNDAVRAAGLTPRERELSITRAVHDVLASVKVSADRLTYADVGQAITADRVAVLHEGERHVVATDDQILSTHTYDGYRDTGRVDGLYPVVHERSDRGWVVTVTHLSSETEFLVPLGGLLDALADPKQEVGWASDVLTEEAEDSP
jgi:hypothetical protein